MMSSGTVHIVDDDEAVRDSLQALLEAKKYDTRVYPTAEAFLKQADLGQVPSRAPEIRLAVKADDPGVA